MRYLIEPCCAQRHLRQLRDAIGKNGKAEMEGYEDMSLMELLPALLKRYAQTEMIIVAPTVPDMAAEAIGKQMKQQWARGDGPGSIDCIARLTIITDASKKKSPTINAWLKENPWGDRLHIISRKQEDACLLLPDLAIIGPVSMRYGARFTATVTSVPEEVSALWQLYTQPTEEPAPAEEEEGTLKEEMPEDSDE